MHGWGCLGIALAMCSVELLLHAVGAPRADAFIDTWGFTPAFLSAAPGLHESATLFTSLFIPASPAHLGLTLLALLLLGRRIERGLGTVRFLVGFLSLGAMLGVGRWVVEPDRITPVVGMPGVAAGARQDGAILILCIQTTLK